MVLGWDWVGLGAFSTGFFAAPLIHLEVLGDSAAGGSGSGSDGRFPHFITQRLFDAK